MKFALRLISVACLCAFAGCSTNHDQPAQDQNHVSTIPWNRPEKWEGTGALGGMAPTTQ